jgi:hypothetical protein
MAKNFVYDITKDIEGAKISIKKYLSDYEYANLLVIKGTIDDLSLKKIVTTEEAVQVVFHSSGTVGVNLKTIKVGK